ncbi:MAG: MAPEG family protein, partial [Asticcacaulis sp.]
DRAFRNFQETFPILIALALALHLTDRGEGLLPLAGAALYVASRILFVLLYAMGSRLRSLVWGLSFFALLMLFAGLFI